MAYKTRSAVDVQAMLLVIAAYAVELAAHTAVVYFAFNALALPFNLTRITLIQAFALLWLARILLHPINQRRGTSDGD